MMMVEFIERTGYVPTHEEFEKLNELYMEIDITKDRFCELWVMGHKRLIAWQKKATENIIEREKELYKELADVRKELNVLRYDRRIDFYDGWAKRFYDLEEKERDIIRHIRLLDRN